MCWASLSIRERDVEWLWIACYFLFFTKSSRLKYKIYELLALKNVWKASRFHNNQAHAAQNLSTLYTTTTHRYKWNHIIIEYKLNKWIRIGVSENKWCHLQTISPPVRTDEDKKKLKVQWEWEIESIFPLRGARFSPWVSIRCKKTHEWWIKKSFSSFFILKIWKKML